MKSKRYFFFLVVLFSSANAVVAQTRIDTIAIDRFIRARMESDRLPGLAVAIVQHDKIILSKGYGSDSKGQPITEASPFAIASLSKAFTAMAVMQLADQGKINIDQPFITYVPAFRAGDERMAEITVRQLLNQTSGLSDVTYRDMQLRHQPQTTAEAVSAMQSAQLETEPGHQFHYHNPNYQLLAALVEEVSQEPFAHYLQHHLFTPLSMDHTWEVANTRLLHDDARFTNGYSFLFGSPIKRNEPEWFVEGAAGIVSTSSDMARWLQAQLAHGNNKKDSLLRPASWKAMITPPGNIASPYAMGWIVEKDLYHHNGILWTYSSDQIVLPGKDIGMVVLFNSGINAYTDYNAYARGIMDILDHQTPVTTGLSPRATEWMVSGLFVIIIAFGIYRLLCFHSLQANYAQRARWLNIAFIAARLLPLLLLLFTPQVIVLFAGRALSWQGILLMIPGLLIGLALVALVELLIAARLLIVMFKR